MVELVPQWVRSLRPLIRFAQLVRERGLQGAIVGFVAGFLVSVITGFAEFVIGQVQAAFDAVVTAAGIPFDALGRAFAPVGDVVLVVFTEVNDILFEIVQPLGIAAPFAVIVIYATFVLVLLRTARTVLGQVPVVGAVTEFLGVGS